MITVSAAAAKRIWEILEEEGNTNFAFRISVVGGGCSGFKYNFSIIDPKWVNLDDYHVIETNGIKLVIDTMSMEYLDGSTVDFIKRLFSSEFKINNPKAKQKCGCGNSFGA